MKKVFLNVWKKALVLSLAVIPFVITACGEDSGLGSTVDTEAPKIEITYPPLGANIRGTFVLAGNCDDDKSVKSIIVTVTDTTTKKVVGTVPASIENEGKSWKASINNYNDKDKKYDYLDGNYQFTAEVHDGAGHKSNASRVFDLDNTAPVFVASNPGVIKSQGKKASAYGSIFTIDGTIADDHTIASLTAKIFDENGTLIGDYKEEDIATAGGTSVTIASHYVDKNDGTARTVQNERYTQIYGDNDAAGTKKYYCTVLVEDNTKSYTNPGESDNTTSGNITSKVYLYDSVYKSLMSSKSGNRYGLSAADFMTLLNGTRATDEKTEPALKILKEVVVDTSAEAEDKDANKLCFSLNPMANPTYSVNGFAVSKDAGGNLTYKEAFSDSTVVVSVNAGLDKTAILPGNLKVWTVLVDGLSPEDAQKRVNLVANKVTALQKIHSTVDEVHERADEIIDGAIKYADKEFGDGSLALVKDNSDDTGASVQTETLSCVLPKDTYISGKVYAFVVTGYDEDDVAFLQNTLYAFKANEAGVAPTLIITEPTNQSYIKTTEGLVFKGRTYLPDGSTLKVAELTINLRVQDENKQNIAVGKTDGYTVALTYNETSGYSSTDESLTYDTSTKVWTFTPSKLADYNDISASEGEGKSYFYTVDISSESSSRNATSKTISVHVDSTMPRVSIANVTPYVSGSNFYSEAGENIRNYVNGDITVKFNIEETNLKDVSYRVLVDGEEKVSPVSLGKVYSGSIDLDTTKWTETAKEKKNTEVVITAVDVCGNTTSYSTTEYNTVTYKNDKNEEVNFNKPIIICQETDIPQIKFANAELSYKTGKDDQIVEHSFLVVEEPKNASDEQKAEVKAKNDANKKSIVASHNLFNIKNNNTIQIALDDDDNIASAKVVLYDEAGKLYEADGFENPSIKQIGKPSFTWNYLLPAKEGIYQVYIEVTDSKLKDDLSETVKLWRTNKVGKFYVAVDDGAPTVEIKNPVAGSYQKKAFAANGTVSEKDNVILTRSIYKLDAKAEDKKSVDITAKITKDKDGNFIWAETDEDIKDLADGEYILSYTATDRYEQSYTSDVRVKVDTKAPVFKDDKSKVFVSSNAEAGKAYVEKTWFNSEALNLSGEFEEANGISNVYYWLDTDVNTVEKDGKTQIVFSDILNEDKTVKTKGASGSFTAVTENGISTYKTTIPDFTECSAANAHKLTLIAVDLAGNESEKIEYTSIKVDMTAPTFENYYYKMGAVKGEVSGNILTNGENDVTLYGLISDAASGVDVNNFVLNVINGTTKSILADRQTVNNITFTTEPTSWTEGDGENQQTVNVDTTAGFEKWIEKAEAATATTFKDGASIEDTTKITGWKAVIDKDSFKAGEVRTNYFDNAGNGNKNYKMFSIRVDETLPELKNSSLKDEKAGYSAYKAKDFKVTVGGKEVEIPHYYVNNDKSAGHTFAIEGIATDNEGIAKVELITGNGIAKDADKGEFKWTGIDLSALDADSNVTIKITDIANNVFEQKIHITPDVKAPEGKHSTGNVDNYFRIGDSKVGEVSDVGFGQSAETYGKDSSLKIRGYFTENGSGLNMIYYKTFASIPSATDIDEFKNDYEGKKSGYFSPLEVEESRTIGEEVIPTNFKTTIPGFKEGKNYLVLIAVDKVGNAELDNVTYKYTPDGTTSEISLAGCYEIKVDMTQPRFERFYYKMGAINAEVKGDILTNGENNVTLYGLISDADSGVDVSNFVLNVINGTANTVIANSANITFTTEATSWNDGSVTYSTASTDGLGKWVEKATFGAAPSDTTKITGWKAEIPNTKFTTGEVRADYYDKAGNSSLNIKMFSVRVDDEKPKLSNHTLTAEKKDGEIIGFKAYKTADYTFPADSDTKIPHYYVNNSDGHTFSLSGVATDNEGVAKVELVGAEGKTADKGEFSWTGITLPTLDSDGNITVKITDIANNVFEQKIHITIDTQAPSGVHDTESDSKGKDTIFRVGDADNLLEEINAVRTPTVTKVEGMDKDVGGKYAPGTYGNSNSIKIRGQFNEEGSGLKEIYYKIFQKTPPSKDAIENFVKNYDSEKSGVFAPLSSNLDDSANDKRLVKVNTSETAYSYEPIQSNYKMAIAGFAEGKNYLVVAAVDNVGNIALDTVTYKYTPEGETDEISLDGCYSINVDTVTPELVEGSVTAKIDGKDKTPSQILTNFAGENADITIAGAASDADSGVEKVVLSVKVGNENKTVKTTPTPDSSDTTKKNWTADIDHTWFSTTESGNFTVYANITDKAGMGKNLSVATIIVDKKAPDVVLEKPTDADTSATESAAGIQINGIINLKGTINDENVLPTPAITAIEYKEKTATEWTTLTADSHTQMQNLALSGSYTFYANSFDTRALTDTKEYYIRAKAVDSANNTGLSDAKTENVVLVKVDQDTDRPLIKITTLDSNVDPTTSSEVIQGTVSDDDGVAKFEYKDEAVTDDEWHEITLNSGSWRIEGLASGKHRIKFRVTDNAGTVFETGKTSFADSETHFTETGYPYVAYGKNDKIINNAVVSFAVDLNAPVVESIAIASTTSTTEPTEPEAGSTTPSPYGVTKSFGANAKYMWIKALAKEDVALNSDVAKDVTLKVGKDTIDVTGKVKRTGDDYGYEDTDAGFTYIIGPIDTSTFTSEGTLTVALVINDKSKRASDAKTANIYIDMTAPEVTVTSPNVSEGKSSDSIIGTTVLRGQISDSSTIAKFFYMIPTQAQIGASGIFKNLDANGKGYTFNSEHGWKDLKEIETSKAGVVNDYTDHTSMLWEIPVTSSKFKTKLSDSTLTDESLSFIEYATAKEGDNLKYAEVSTVESSVNEATTPAADKKYCVYVPLYFYTEDETGMAKVTATMILVDPYAGIPRVEIKTPENFAKTGGNLNFQGSVTDDAGDADKVVLTKLEFSTVDAVEADFVGTTAKDDSTFDWKEVTRDILAEAEVVTKGTLSTTDATITAEGKPSSWKISINTSAISTNENGVLAILLGTHAEGTGEDAVTVANDIKIARATFVAYDKNGTASTFQVETLAADGTALVKNIFVDKNAPKMKNIQLVQYDDGTGSDPEDIEISDIPSISRSYSAGMYVSGKTGTKQWYLKATIEDDASVEGFSITSGKNYITLSGKAEKGKPLPTGWIVEGLGKKECTFIIPIETSNPKNGKDVSATQFYPTIELDDGQHTDVTQNLSFFVDNDAPTMYLNDTEDETPDDAISVLNKSKLRLTDYNGLVVGSDNVVENSDGQYSFGDSIKEAGSGLAYVAVWFRKEKSGVGYWYNAIETKTATGTSINHDGNGVTIDSTNVKINDENLPVKVFTDCARPALNQIGHSSLAGYTDFGVGSLVKIGGSYHLITDKGEGGTSGTITIDDDVDTSFTTVEMVYANVVNHQVAEGFESGWTVSNDDGDGFVEMVKQSGNNYKWQATLRSDFIPDGPVQIHVVAFDEAGNVNSGFVETSIQNNRPRISKVFLGTDLNGNGTFDYFSENSTGAVAANNELYPGYAANGTEYGELSFYSALSSDGKIQGTVTLKSSNFVAKDKLLVLPEIIGGNTTSTQDLKYLYKVVDDVKDASITKLSIASGSLKSLYTDSDSLYLADKAGTAQTVAELLAENHKADKWNYYDTTQTDYKGEDNTHGGIVTGKYKGLVLDNDTLKKYESWTSGQAVGSVKYFAFTIWDATSGTTQGKDSLYSLLKIPMVVNVVDDIAPKAVIHPFYWNSKEDGSFCYDEEGNPEGHIDILSAADEVKTSAKPGVSGQVWIRATVEDETRLTKATFTDPGDTKMVVANYTDGKWVPVTSGLPEHWKKVEILESPEPNQAGHTMTFRVAIDMTKYGLSLSESVNVGAVDKNSNASSDDTVQTIKKALTSHYEMKFVPYIKSIYPATESSASRSRLGKFPVHAGKPMVIEGMNFAAGATYWVSFYKTKDKAKQSSDWGEAGGTPITAEDGKITINAPEYSRWVKVWIQIGSTDDMSDWIGTMNNENENGGYNIEEGYVAGEVDKFKRPTNGLLAANKAGTNFWTDDRYIAVWNVPDETLFKGSINPHSGVIKKVDQYNSGSGAPSSVSEGANIDAAPAPGGGWLYKQKGYDTAVDPVTGMNDSYYAAISSDDLKLYGYVSGRTYETHGDNIAFNSSEVAYVAPVDEMDYTIVNGVPYYVMQDNSLGGDSGSVWGLGLCMMREGIWYDRGYFNPYKGNTIEEEKLPYFIERQGYNKASHARDSSGGYDSVLYQFKNPRITGWYDKTDSLRYSSAGSKPSVTGVDYIYISYYDSYAKCLKYAAYRVGHRFKSNDGKYANTDLKEWGKIDVDHDLDIVAEMTSSPMTAGNQPKQKTYDHMTDGASVVAGNDTTSNNPTFTEIAGEWSDVLVDTTSGRPRPVIVYYNKTNRSLEVAYGDNEFPQSTSEWTKSTGIRPIGVKSDFGRYVSAAMDKDGNLHVAAQDADTAKLYYLYLTKSGSTYRVSKSVAVDASNGAGRWTDIELTDPEGSSLDAIAPVISYIDTSFMGTTKGVKAAYVVDVEEDGTPIFEAMTDPARYSASDQRTSVMADVKETKAGSVKAPVAVGFNSDMLALDFLRAEE